MFAYVFPWLLEELRLMFTDPLYCVLFLEPEKKLEQPSDSIPDLSEPWGLLQDAYSHFLALL